MSEFTPGAIVHGEGDLLLNVGRATTHLEVTNTGDRAIQVGSHFHLFEANSSLRFDRRASYGKRLDIPSGTAVRFEAGQTHQVTLVPFAGAQTIIGFNNLARGADIEEAVSNARSLGFIARDTDQL